MRTRRKGLKSKPCKVICSHKKQSKMKTVLAHFDGSCEPFNPGGDMGMGVVIFVDQQKVKEQSTFIPRDPTNSNNVAEYLAFEKILDYLLENNLDGERITILGDSKLVVEQMNDRWKIKSGLYTPVAYRCYNLLTAQFKCNINFRIQWVRREQNAIADLLSRKAAPACIK